MIPEIVDVHIHYGGEFIGGFDYVGGKIFKIEKFEWGSIGGDRELLVAAVGYDKIIKSGVRVIGSKVFTFLPDDDSVVQDIVEKAVDVEKGCVDLYMECVNQKEELFPIRHGKEDGVGSSGDKGLRVIIKDSKDEAGERCLVNKGKGKIAENEEQLMGESGESEDEMMNTNDTDFCEYGFESDSDEVRSDFSDDDEEVIEARKELRLRKNKAKMIQDEIHDSDPVHDSDLDSIDSLDSIDLDTGVDQEENLVKRKKSKSFFFAINSNLKDMDWELGMKFKDGVECKDAIQSWAIVNGWNIRWTKSSSKIRVQAECDKKCKWRLYASKLSDEPTFVIKSYYPRHSCIRVKRNRQANRIWISKQLVSLLKRNPSMSAALMRKEMEERFDVIITFQMCYRAKALAFQKIRGSFNGEYKKLRSYVLELMKSDVEGKFVLKTFLEKDGKTVFQRIFIGFSALRKGFLHGCRHIISFDACFLKTILGGVLLAAVGKDCNYQMYPIAWAVVEVEDEETWTWFCQLLFEQFGIGDGIGWSFMSDKQKGLINAIQRLAPKAEHRHCARHVYANFKKNWGGPKYRELFWACVKACTPTQFKTCLLNLKAESEEAWSDFCNKNPKSFCKSLISSHTKADTVDNNICESFNSYILQARDKPILHMLQDIRLKVMRRHHDIANTLEKCNDEICPNVRKRIYMIERFTKFCDITPCVGDKYEVRYFEYTYIVDLNARTCSCRAWVLSGIPCCHALACIHYKREDIVAYVDLFFMKSNAIELYKHGLEPIHGEEDWPTDDMSDIFPPKIRRLPGRPKKNRKRGNDEVKKYNAHKMTRHGMKMRCKICGGLGHNRRGCKAVPKATTEGGQSGDTSNAKRFKKDTCTSNSRSRVKVSNDATVSKINSGVDASNDSERNIRNDKKLAESENISINSSMFGVLQTERENIFFKPPGGNSKAIYVSGAQAIKMQTRSRTAKNDAGDGGSQVVNPTPP